MANPGRKPFNRKEKKEMNRREFIKGAVLTAALVSSGRAFADYEGEGSEGPLLKIKNRENPSVGEQKHVPGIEAPAQVKKDEWFDVKVKVGFMKEHPSKAEHWITFIKLIADGDSIAKAEYPVGGAAASSATFRVKVAGTTRLQPIANCNLHGTWIGDPVTVNV
jgi:superoxide reductase